jgi:hypothetical protein
LKGEKTEECVANLLKLMPFHLIMDAFLFHVHTVMLSYDDKIVICDQERHGLGFSKVSKKKTY